MPRPPALWLCALAALLAHGAARADLRVVIRGLDGDELANVEARLSVVRFAEDDGTDEVELRRLHRQAPDEIRGALQAFGFYDPRIHAELRGKAPDWEAVYDVTPGPSTRLTEVRIELVGDGREFPALVEVQRGSALRKGERVNHGYYESTKTALAQTAYRNGFLDAGFRTHVLRVNPEKRVAQAHLVLDTGPRYFFGPVTVEAPGLDTEFLARYVPIVPGEPFDPQKLLDAQFVLSDLGYFGSVEAQPKRELTENGRIPVAIVTTPRPPRRYDVGIGYGTDTGARLTFGAEFRRLTDTGHKLRGDLRLSEVKQRLGAEYRIPLGTQAGESLGFAAAYTEQEVGDGRSRRWDAGTSLDRTPGEWQRRMYLNFQYEETLFPEGGTDSTRLMTPGVAISRGESDNAIHARLGWYVFFDVHAAHEDAVSTTTFVQGRAVLRGALPLGDEGRLLARVEYGGSLVDEFLELPGSQRFFAGGDQSVRGYGYQSLGPKDENGVVIGGEFLNTYSLEAEYPVWRHWGAAVFIDAGNADDDPAPRLYRGVGVGVRYRAPVGTLQLDLAHPVDGDRGGIRPHLGIRVGF